MPLIYFILIPLLAFPLSLHAASGSLKKWVDEFTLRNGIHVIAVRRRDVPVFSAYIGVKAGGIDEPPGKSGLAHMLEHMAFKGTPEIGTSQEFSMIYERNGAQGLNASTSKDMTNYYVNLPFQ